MEKENLIKKWLDNDLNQEELQEFEALEDYDQLTKISRNLKQFKVPEINDVEVLKNIISKKKNKKTPVIKLIQRFSQVAAVLLICFGVYYFLNNKATEVTTALAEKTITTLPDGSTVHLNADSSISFDENNWVNERSVELSGEAFFKVAKGSKFNVATSSGIVSVLGTQFNVKDRSSNFEVVCFEGLVGVQYKGESLKLSPGDSFKDGNLEKNVVIKTAPYWIHNKSNFTSEPVINVIKELERQYDVSIDTRTIDESKLFTGQFVHDDLDIALKAITIPLKVTYSIQGKTIILERE